MALDQDPNLMNEIDKLLETFSDVGINLSSKLKQELSPTPNDFQRGHRYGSRIALLSGSILREICSNKFNIESLFNNIFSEGIDSIYDDVVAEMIYSTRNIDELRTLLIENHQIILEETSQNLVELNNKYKSNIFKVLESVEVNSIIYWILYLLFQSLGGYLEGQSFTEVPYYQEKNYTFANCKDSEFYFWANLNEKYINQYGSRGCVITDENNNPIIYQKIGRYNATTINSATGITLKELKVNGIIMPAGTLLGIVPQSEDYITSGADHILPISKIKGIYPLRMTIFCCNSELEAASMFEEQYEEFKKLSDNADFTLQTVIDHSNKLLRGIQQSAVTPLSI